jgi:hypothetical protein
MTRHQRPLTPRKLLTTLAGAAVAGPVISVAAPNAVALGSGSGDTTPQAAGALPLTITNGSGTHGNSSVYVYIVGNQDGRQVRVAPDGPPAPISLADNGADGKAYGFAFDDVASYVQDTPPTGIQLTLTPF